MDEKRFRFDLIVAVCALLVSSVAAGASAYQTYVINQQYQASIWPYLSFTLGATPDNLSLVVKNYGLGPALIRSYEISRNGKPVASFAEYVKRFEDPRDKATVTLETIGAGAIIPASEGVPLVNIQKGPKIVRGIVSEERLLDVSICYCSLLGRCWMRRLQDLRDQPEDVRVCPLTRAPRKEIFGP